MIYIYNVIDIIYYMLYIMSAENACDAYIITYNIYMYHNIYILVYIISIVY